MKKMTLALLCFTLSSGAFAANEQVSKFRLMKATTNNDAYAVYEGLNKNRIINASANHSIKVKYQFCTMEVSNYVTNDAPDNWSNPFTINCKQSIDLTVAANSYKDIEVPAASSDNASTFVAISEATGFKDNRQVSHTTFMVNELINLAIAPPCSTGGSSGVIVLNDYNTDLVVCDSKQTIF